MVKIDLNALQIPTHDGPKEALCNPSVDGGEYGVSVFFRDLERKVLDRIRDADVVLGCVAWLTSGSILSALTGKKGVSIIVQKEDFLRPDVAAKDRSTWAQQLRRQYDAIPALLCRYDVDGLACLSYASDPGIEAIRCVGNHNRDKVPAFPRMHNKFLLFCNLVKKPDEHGVLQRGVDAYEVWTGSYNLTENATRSLENAVAIRNPAIVAAYMTEYCNIAALSEPLDWESEWCEPEWRIGS